jgi:hypothetical protein
MDSHSPFYRTNIKVVISTKAALFEKKVNEALNELQDNDCDIVKIDSDISYSGDKGYQAMAVITYVFWEVKPNELDNTGFNIDFGIGEPPAFDQDN